MSHACQRAHAGGKFAAAAGLRRQGAPTSLGTDRTDAGGRKEIPMSDDKTKAHGQDRERINVHEDYELRDWSKSLGVSQDEVKKAVAAVGDRAEKVREYLKNGHK